MVVALLNGYEFTRLMLPTTFLVFLIFLAVLLLNRERVDKDKIARNIKKSFYLIVTFTSSGMSKASNSIGALNYLTNINR